MSTTAIILSGLYVLCLTGSVAPRSLGLVNEDDKASRRFQVPLVFGATQGLMALLGMALGNAIDYLFEAIGIYMTFAMMLVVTVKLFLDAMQILKGKALYTFSSEWGFLLLSILASTNTFLMSLMSSFFLPFGKAFPMAVAAAGLLWAYFTVKVRFSPKVMKTMSFLEFSESVFLLVIAVLFMFTNLLAQ